MATEWYYQLMGEEIGPISSTELRKHAQQNRIFSDTFVRKGSRGQWVLAERVKGLLKPVEFTNKPPQLNQSKATSESSVHQEAREKPHPTTKPCPYCNGSVSTDAIICKECMSFCHELLLTRKATAFKSSNSGAETADQVVFVNRCPSCKQVTRTPKSRQCFECGFDWHVREAEPVASKVYNSEPAGGFETSSRERLIVPGVVVLGAIFFSISWLLLASFSATSQRAATSETDFMSQSIDRSAKKVVEQIAKTPEGHASIERLGDKDLELTRFQIDNGISNEIAEAAIKEWVLAHGGNFDWNLSEVKSICRRLKRQGR